MALQQHVNHSLSSSFHAITGVMQLFLPEQAFEISRMKSHSTGTGSYNMQHVGKNFYCCVMYSGVEYVVCCYSECIYYIPHSE